MFPTLRFEPGSARWKLECYFCAIYAVVRILGNILVLEYWPHDKTGANWLHCLLERWKVVARSKLRFLSDNNFQFYWPSDLQSTVVNRDLGDWFAPLVVSSSRSQRVIESGLPPSRRLTVDEKTKQVLRIEPWRRKQSVVELSKLRNLASGLEPMTAG